MKGANHMNMTLHLTDACNMACKYCFQTRSPSFMMEETARKAVDLSVFGNKPATGSGSVSVCEPASEKDENRRDSSSTGICFFGGEPLLLRDLIMNTVKY